MDTCISGIGLCVTVQLKWKVLGNYISATDGENVRVSSTWLWSTPGNLIFRISRKYDIYLITLAWTWNCTGSTGKRSNMQPWKLTWEYSLTEAVCVIVACFYCRPRFWAWRIFYVSLISIFFLRSCSSFVCDIYHGAHSQVQATCKACAILFIAVTSGLL